MPQVEDAADALLAGLFEECLEETAALASLTAKTEARTAALLAELTPAAGASGSRAWNQRGAKQAGGGSGATIIRPASPAWWCATLPASARTPCTRLSRGGLHGGLCACRAAVCWGAFRGLT